MFLFLVGKFCSVAVFNVAYIYTCELFPTQVRTQAAGVTGLVGKVAGIATYLLDLIKPFWMPGPLVIMGYVDTKSKLGLGRIWYFLPDIRCLPDPAGYAGYPAR